MTDLTFETISETNRRRAALWHENASPWSAADWGNALAGETGELCNEIKKLRRIETGIKPDDPEALEALLRKIEDEAADVFLYLDLIATYFGFNLKRAAARKFNAVSDREGFDVKLPTEGEVRERPVA